MDRRAKCELHMVMFYELSKSSEICSIASQVTECILLVLNAIQKYLITFCEILLSHLYNERSVKV